MQETKTVRNFRSMLEAKWAQGKFVCVGLDSEYKRIPIWQGLMPVPSETVAIFNRKIVDATKDLVCAYKPNIAFYEALGLDGLIALCETTEYIRKVAPDVPIILDAKRGDIGKTNEGYVLGSFGHIMADAITLHPYLGQESLKPFLDEKDKGCIILCRTSNPGSGEFQDRMVEINEAEKKVLESKDCLEFVRTKSVLSNDGPATFYTSSDYLQSYLVTALRVSHFWNTNNNCGLVAGGTYPDDIRNIRKVAGDNMLILIPGIGTQGGDLEQSVKNGKNSKGTGFLINSSSGIIFASSGEDFADAARKKTLELHEEINKHLNSKEV